ncbi:hypothetical protein E1A91_D04G037300v1 [Gossypium mustelinum]|uniref:NAC domain-containing protein n=1 Tax=Gossypium mustelinum TaxID=34275 RepID=A0A5D2V9D7_GOSMU|nr:hypothetical protein E1A91_D04G037300v1 [Gossypium mustelinum]
MEMEDGRSVNHLPPGFRFCPTDEELVLHFLYPKSLRLPCYSNIIPELDLHRLHPWELDGKALMSGKRYFFFSQKMENRVLENGYWKQLDMEEPIFSGGSGKVGVKKLFEFYIGGAPFGMKTNWVMQEYHLCNWGSALSLHYPKTKGIRKLLKSIRAMLRASTTVMKMEVSYHALMKCSCHWTMTLMIYLPPISCEYIYIIC